MIKIQCDERPQESIELTEEQLVELLQFDGVNELDLPWGYVYGDVDFYVEICTNESAVWVYLTRESFEGLREHLTEIVEIPRSEVQPGEMFDHSPTGPFDLLALRPDSPYLDLPSDRIPCVMSNGISWSYAHDVCYVRRPKAIEPSKPDRLAGLRKVFPRATDYTEIGRHISSVVRLPIDLRDLEALRKEYPRGKITILGNTSETVGIFVDGV